MNLSNPFPPTLFLSAVILSFSLTGCEGDSHDLGSEDLGVSKDGGERVRRDGGIPTLDLGSMCAPVGGESCLNGNEIVRCEGDRHQTIATCERGCVFVGGGTLTCLGGAQTFTPASVGLIVDGAVRASLSTVSGATGCALADDYELSPGMAAEQVYLILANVGFGCPDGLYGLNSSCSVEFPGDPSARCAIYRRWEGTRLVAVEALSGAVTVSSAQAGLCSYEVELVIDGQTQTVRFTAETSGQTAEQSCPTPG